MIQPESIVLAVASVRDASLAYLSPELQKLRDVLKDAEEKNFIHVIEHNGVTYNSLSYLLNSSKGKDVTMLHYSGHSTQNGLWVQSKDEHGIISKKPLSNLIKIHKKFRFVFLNSCYSTDIALELTRAGVPYVIGTTDSISDQQAAVVAAKFYQLLAKSGKTIEDAFLLTKDYIDDPLNTDDQDIREAFRTFAIQESDTGGYPWQLYQSNDLKEADKNWTLSRKLSPPLPAIVLAAAGIILVLVLTIWGINRQDQKFTERDKQAKDTSRYVESVHGKETNFSTLDSNQHKNEKKPIPKLSNGAIGQPKQHTEEETPHRETNPIKLESRGESKSLNKQILQTITSLDGASFEDEELESMDQLSFIFSAGNKLEFRGKLVGHPVYGQLIPSDSIHFTIVSQEVSGDITLSNQRRNMTLGITNKETKRYYTIHMQRR